MKEGSKQVVCWSAPSKMDTTSKASCKLMGDAHKTYKKNVSNDDDDRVHIPGNFEDSDSDNDSFAIKLSMLAGLETEGQSSKQAQGEPSKQVWFMNEINVVNTKDSTKDVLASITEGDGPANIEKASHSVCSPEVFIPDDNIITTQESVGMEVDMESPAGDVRVQLKHMMEIDIATNQVQERRRSERLKKDTTLNIMEKVEKRAQKANLEGNSSNNNSFSVLPNEVIGAITSCMGIVVEEDDFDTFNLSKDLEKTRDDLYHKQICQNKNPQTQSVEGGP